MAFVAIIVIPAQGYGQTKIADTTKREGKKITIIGADRYNFQDLDTNSRFVSLAGHAIAQQEKTTFSADSIVLNQKLNTLEAIGNVHINDADSIQTYAEYLRYVGKEKKAYLSKNVKLTDGKGVLTTNDLVYDVQLKTGTYTNGGKVVNGKTVLTSNEGYYYGETRDVYFKKKVVLVDPDFKMYTDTLLYNLNTSVSTFTVATKILNGNRTIKTTGGYYDTQNKKGLFNKRTFIDDSTYTFAANEIALDEISGLSQYQGNAVYRSKDSAGGYDLIAGDIKINKPQGSFLASKKPVLFIKQNKDTIYVSADTLYSTKLSFLSKSRIIPIVRIPPVKLLEKKKVDSTQKAKPNSDSIVIVKQKMNDKAKKDTNNDRCFEAYYNVKVFSDSLQAVCDSLFYSLEDSTLRLYTNPIAWAQNNQITGDTMYLFMENKKPERMYVYENAMTIQKTGTNYYNQIKGNSINAYFKKGKIDYLKAKGNAETIYYGVDDKNKFVAVNKANCDVIDMYFEKKEEETKPQRIVLRNNLQGTAYPMRQVNHEEMRLRGFNWLSEKRPKSKFDILAN